MTFDPNPKAADFRRAGAALAGWATGDVTAVQAVMREATTDNRSFQCLGAILETLTRATGVRDDPDRLDLLRREIARYAAEETEE